MADPRTRRDSPGIEPGAQPLGVASVVSVHKLAHLAGSLASVVVLPRLLGVEDFGRFAFVLSLSYLCQIAGDFGTLDVLAHFVPPAATAGRRRLYSGTLAFKLAVAPVCGAATAIAALSLAGWMRPAWAIAAGIAVALHVVAWVPFQYALAEGRIGAWMTEQSWRQWITLAGIVLLYPVIGFSGVLASLVASEALFCIAGLRWVSHAWRRDDFRLDFAFLRPYVRFGGGFFLANIAAVVLFRSGPVLVATLTSDSLQTGVIELALGVFLVIYVSISQYAQSVLPMLSAAWQRGDRAELQRWIGGFLRAGLIFSSAGVAAVWLVADRAAPLLFGSAFAAAANAIEIIALAMPMAVVAWAGNVLATACGRGPSRMAAAVASTVTFLVLATLSVPAHGAAGAAAAVVAAVSLHSLAMWLLLRRDLDLVSCLVRRPQEPGF